VGHGINTNYVRDLTFNGVVCRGNNAGLPSVGLALTGSECIVVGHELIGNSSGLQLNYDGLSTPAMGNHTIGPGKITNNLLNVGGSPIAISSSRFMSTTGVDRVQRMDTAVITLPTVVAA